MRCRLDKSPTTTLPVCTCGWRGHTTTVADRARREAIAHELDAHPGEHHARDAAKKARRRRRCPALAVNVG